MPPRRRFDTRRDPELRAIRERLEDLQGGVCAICGNPPAKRALNLDHDHRTGRVRGLLCWRCNHLVLWKGVTADLLRAAADYLDGPGVAPFDYVIGVGMGDDWSED